MKLLLYIICLGWVSNSANAQTRKAPIADDENEQTHTLNADAVKGQVHDFTQVLFQGNYPDEFDTSEVFSVQYGANGRVKEYKSIKYENTEKMQEEPPFDKIKTRVAEGEKITYEYDAHGNITHEKSYSIIPANSFMAIWAALMAQYERERYSLGNENKSNSSETARKRKKEALYRTVDSMIQQGMPEQDKITEDKSYTYDDDDNPTYATEEVEHRNFHYSYVHNPNGSVAMKKEIYIYSGTNSAPYFSATVHTFSYAPNGKPELIKTYNAEKDSGDIVNDKYLIRSQAYHYNKAGLTDTITYKQPGYTIKHIMSYEDTLRIAYAILTIHPGRVDTTSYTVYSYKDGDLSETKQWIYNDGRTGEYTRETYSYNKNHLPIETKHYTYTNIEKKEILTEQSLFFYGIGNEDKHTAKRSLRPEKEEEPKQQESKKTNEEYSKPTNIQVTKNNTIAQPNAASQSGEPQAVEAPPPSPVSNTNLKDTFNLVEKLPIFPGDFSAYLQHNLVYPKAALKAKIEGRVFVQFVISYTGDIVSARIIKGLGYGCDEEAIRLIHNMPKWTPGMQNGRAVNVYYTIPVTFKLP